jgi:hypothetical protein
MALLSDQEQSQTHVNLLIHIRLLLHRQFNITLEAYATVGALLHGNLGEQAVVFNHCNVAII